MAILYTEVVSRRFTGGILAGIVTEQRIVGVPKPRKVGATQKVRKPIAGSPYVDTVIAVEECKTRKVIYRL